MAKEALGIDIGGSGIKGAPVNVKKGTLLTERYRIPTPQPATPEAVAATVAEIKDYFRWEGKVGCALPARVRGNTVETAANIHESWIGVKARKVFARHLGRKPAVLNDADAAGLAEVRFGSARKHKGKVLLLTFGTGIGSGFFLDGCLVPNLELGHIQFKGDIAENYCSDRIRKENDMDWATWGARVQEYLEHVEFLLAPDLVIIGGGVSKHDRWAQVSPHLHTRADLVRASAGNEAGIIGAAAATRKKK